MPNFSPGRNFSTRLGVELVTPSVPPADSLLTSLVSYWKLDEGSGQRNDSHGTNHLSDNNTVTSAAGKIGSAALFASASSEYLSAADSPTLQPGVNGFTVSFWVNLSDLSVNRFIFSKDDGVDREWVLYYDATASRFVWTAWTQGGTIVQVNANNFGAPSINTWYHLVCWHDLGGGFISIAVNDGTPNGIGFGVDVANKAAPVWIGRGYAGDYTSGMVDEACFHSRPLTAGERTRLYNSGNGLTYPFS